MATENNVDIQEIKHLLAHAAKPAWEPAGVANTRMIMAMADVLPSLVALVEQLQARVEQLEYKQEA